MTRAQLLDAVLTEARRYKGEQEQPRGSNRSTRIDYWLKECGLGPGLPWCAAFVGQVGRQAVGHQWPCPRVASVVALTLWAQDLQNGSGLWQPTPQLGDLFVLWEPGLAPPRYGHVGFVEAITPAGFTTIEGNTNPGGGRDGYGVFERARVVLATTRFIRWVDAITGVA